MLPHIDMNLLEVLKLGHEHVSWVKNETDHLKSRT
jgi:hypothetical protein